MRKSAIDHMVTIANDDDFIEVITPICKPIVIKKKNLAYTFMDYCIRINDNAKKEYYMIQLETVEAIKIVKPKFKGISWYDGKTKVKADA